MTEQEVMEQALSALESTATDPQEPGYAIQFRREEKAIEALRQALDKPPVKTYCGGKPNYCTTEVTTEVPCKTHPDAPHGFDRNASHSADRHVCECEGWEPVDETAKRDNSSWVDIEEEEINALWQQFDVAKGWSPSVFALAVAHKLKEKNA